MPSVIDFIHYLYKDDVLKMLKSITNKYKIINNITVNYARKKNNNKYILHLNEDINEDLFIEIYNNIRELFGKYEKDHIIFFYRTENETCKKYTYSNYRHVRYLEWIKKEQWRDSD